VFAVLTHVGRRSGRAYKTPLGACAFGDGFVLALAYGTEVDWCRNVMAAGTRTPRWKGQEYALERPEIITGPEVIRAWPLRQRFVIWASGIHQFLWVHKQSEVPKEES
jgi:deazaflavin-dependent oxidoreductase (nitroreductase family)